MRCQRLVQAVFGIQTSELLGAQQVAATPDRGGAFAGYCVAYQAVDDVGDTQQGQIDSDQASTRLPCGSGH